MLKAFVVSLVVLALAAADAGLSGAAFPQEGREEGNAIKSDVDLVSVYFTVRDSKKQLATQLEQQDFRVFEDGREQPIRFFARHSDAPLDVGILLDTGTNMGWILGKEAQAASMFLKEVVRPNDQGFIMSYSAQTETLEGPTSNIDLLQRSVDEIRGWETAVAAPGAIPQPPLYNVIPIGTSAQPYNLHRQARLYDAIRVAAHRYLEGETGRKVIVAVAMSGDSKSESTLKDALSRPLHKSKLSI